MQVSFHYKSLQFFAPVARVTLHVDIQDSSYYGPSYFTSISTLKKKYLSFFIML